MKLWTTLGAAAAALLLSLPAQAATMLFSIKGSYNAEFTLDSNPVPDFVDTGFPLFAIAHLPGFSDSSNGFADLTFFGGTFAGLIISDNGDGFTWLLDALGPQLFSGDVSAPVFSPSTFALTDMDTGGEMTLTISEVAAVPEPETWALMIAGFGIAGAALRRSRRTVASRRQTA